ncbi:MAG: hypothetical protein UGF89_02140 [Acutalibacteraceae bacterium]|nr:hypothetical protein [Acutalibacteraceae bacterium]
MRFVVDKMPENPSLCPFSKDGVCGLNHGEKVCDTNDCTCLLPLQKLEISYSGNRAFVREK